jgi:peptidoglycan biosynthesis protein MviN/MurJ (putative lipid II flippase)
MQAAATADSVAKYVEPSRFLMIFPFAFTTALADMVWEAKNAKTAFKLIVHYVVLTVAFYVFLYLPVQSTQNPTSPIIIIALLSVIYFICASIVLVILSKIRKKKEAETPYVPVYSSVKTPRNHKN